MLLERLMSPDKTMPVLIRLKCHIFDLEPGVYAATMHPERFVSMLPGRSVAVQLAPEEYEFLTAHEITQILAHIGGE